MRSAGMGALVFEQNTGYEHDELSAWYVNTIWRALASIAPYNHGTTAPSPTPAPNAAPASGLPLGLGLGLGLPAAAAVAAFSLRKRKGAAPGAKADASAAAPEIEMGNPGIDIAAGANAL
jgi:hypothetical protein